MKALETPEEKRARRLAKKVDPNHNDDINTETFPLNTSEKGLNKWVAVY